MKPCPAGLNKQMQQVTGQTKQLTNTCYKRITAKKSQNKAVR
jgi:hypothetical protein